MKSKPSQEAGSKDDVCELWNEGLKAGDHVFAEYPCVCTKLLVTPRFAWGLGDIPKVITLL